MHVHMCQLALAALGDGVDDASDTLGQQAAAQAELVRQLAAALAHLQERQGELESRIDAGCTPAQQARQLQQLLPLAAELAVLLQQHWQQPEEVAAVGLELAHIAATRSCAYLQCSNVEAEGGGPAAGQGTGSMRCGACRAVWYCGTACSHAEWRVAGGGGHKRVCNALGAVRLQQRAPA